MKKLLSIFAFNFLLINNFVYADESDGVVRIFPLENYSQKIEKYIDKDSDSQIISNKVIKHKIENFKEHLFGELSPWSESYVRSILEQSNEKNLKDIEVEMFEKFRMNCVEDEDVIQGNKPAPKSYAENFRPYSCNWFDQKILPQLNLNQFDISPKYNSSHRVITVDNTSARALPTFDPIYYNYKIAGEGYPFDNLQESAIWAGTPLYVVAYSKDKTWSFVLSGSKFMAWVPTSDLAIVDDAIIEIYRKSAKENKLHVITKTESSIYSLNGEILISSYIGSIFLAKEASKKVLNEDQFNHILIPYRKNDGKAELINAKVSSNNSAKFPMKPSQKNFFKVIEELKGRNYGWGGLNFYNDCSQELQSLFTVFGIWLPRNSSQQLQEGRIKDLSALDTESRIKNTALYGRSLVTLVYIKGHIMLYIGKLNFDNIQDVPFIYHNIWGLRPVNNSYRSVIGKSVFFPILSSYRENPDLISLADSNRREIYTLSYLDEIQNYSTSSSDKISNYRSLIFGN